MRSLLKKIFGKKINSVGQTIRQYISDANPQLVSDSSILYEVGYFIYNQAFYQSIKEQINNKEPFNEIMKDWVQDLNQDIVQFYVLEDIGKYYLISMFDPYDYLQREKVLDIWDIDKNYLSVNHLKRID